VSVLALGMGLGLAQAQATSQVIHGRVVSVGDGDSLTLLDAAQRRHRIRLEGIDAPELGQAHGRAARQHLAGLAARRDAVAHCSKTDSYGRHVCRLRVDGRDAGLAQVRAGMAWLYDRYADELPAKRRRQYEDAQARARAARVGLWADPRAIPPWEWRRQAAAPAVNPPGPPRP
jgi:endonuclease YncB( thermonuclease family)